MTSIFRKPTIVQSVVGARPSKFVQPTSGLLHSSTSSYQTFGYILLYILAFALVVVVILMLLGIPINLSFLDFRHSSKKVADNSVLFWDTNTTFTNLQTPSPPQQSISSTSYSCLMDCVLFNTRSFQNIWREGDGPYRHIAHRGSEELLASTVKGTIIGGCGVRGNATDLPEYGLPVQMNPGIFLDPNLNDIIVFVDTAGGDRESLRIPNIPLDIPFRIAIVVNEHVLEVYLNCRLETTKILKNRPIIVENLWYGLAGAAGAEAQIQNLRIWNISVNSSDMKHFCPALPSFSTKRVICDAAETPLPADAAKPTAASPDLGFSNAFQKCPK